jgi:hypothetical protein
MPEPSEIVARTISPTCGCEGETLCDLHFRDELYRKPMKVCWSLSTSKEFHGELPAPTQELKDLITREACLAHDRDKSPSWEKFRA